jgi:flagellar hook assembly protein FlgD
LTTNQELFNPETEVAMSNTVSVRTVGRMACGAIVRLDVNESTTIKAAIAIYDPMGIRVRTLACGFFGPGAYDFEWDGRDDVGNPLAEGMYYARAVSDDIRSAEKILLRK